MLQACLKEGQAWGERLPAITTPSGPHASSTCKLSHAVCHLFWSRQPSTTPAVLLTILLHSLRSPGRVAPFLPRASTHTVCPLAVSPKCHESRMRCPTPRTCCLERSCPCWLQQIAQLRRGVRPTIHVANGAVMEQARLQRRGIGLNTTGNNTHWDSR